MNEQDLIKTDVVIVGAGMVGLALAARLSEKLRICLVDAIPPLFVQNKEPSAGFSQRFDLRVSALTKASQCLLAEVGAWEDVALHASAYEHMHVWDAEGTGKIDFNAADIYEKSLGHIVENSVTQAALWKIIEKKPHIHLLFGSPVVSIAEAQQKDRCLTLANGKSIQAALVVAADGAHSRLRELAKFDMRQWSYEHTAIVTTVKMEKSHQKTAWQRFTHEGPLAFLPLKSHPGDTQHCSIVWSLKNDVANAMLALDDDAFAQRLAKAFEFRLGKVEAIDQRIGFPLTQRHAKTYVKTRLVLVGDAAHTIHPLAGQGVNLGFQDAVCLADEINHQVERKGDVGDFGLLKRFERRRQRDNLLMMAAMEGLKRVFEQDALPIRWLRNAGFNWVDKIQPLKKYLIRQAMGL